MTCPYGDEDCPKIEKLDLQVYRVVKLMVLSIVAAFGETLALMFTVVL